MKLKRVVVTGLGALTPIGNNIQEFWNGLINGVSGAGPITHFDATNFKTKFACEVKNFNVEDFIDRKEARKMDRYAQYAMVTATEAMTDANFDLEKLDNISRNIISKMKATEVYDNLLEWTKEYDEEFYKLLTDNKDYAINLFNIEHFH